MSTTITAQDGTGDDTTPGLVDGFNSTADPDTIVERLIGGGIAVTLNGGELQTGTLNLWYTSDDDAETARQLFRRRTSFALVSDERPTINMTFVRSGGIGRATRDSMNHVWVLTVGYQEIEP